MIQEENLLKIKEACKFLKVIKVYTALSIYQKQIIKNILTVKDYDYLLSIVSIDSMFTSRYAFTLWVETPMAPKAWSKIDYAFQYYLHKKHLISRYNQVIDNLIPSSYKMLIDQYYAYTS